MKMNSDNMKKKVEKEDFKWQLQGIRRCGTKRLPWLGDEELDAIYCRTQGLPSVPVSELAPMQSRAVAGVVLRTMPLAAAVALLLLALPVSSVIAAPKPTASNVETVEQMLRNVNI